MVEFIVGLLIGSALANPQHQEYEQLDGIGIE